MSTPETTNDAQSIDTENSSEDNVHESHEVTDLMVGTQNENHDGVVRGAYPEGIDPSEFVGTLRRFVSKNVQYIQVVGDMSGHAVYRTLNAGEDGNELYSLPWDRFIDETAHVNPESPGAVTDDPARTVVRTDFDRRRERRQQKVETGCTCLPDELEACDNCGGK